MFNDFTATTHLGVKGKCKPFSFFEIHGIVSNPEGQGSYAGESPKYGLQMLFKSHDFYLLPGYYTRREQNESITLWSGYGGYRSPDFQVHLEVNELERVELLNKAWGFMLFTTWRFYKEWT